MDFFRKFIHSTFEMTLKFLKNTDILDKMANKLQNAFFFILLQNTGETFLVTVEI